MSPSTLPAGSCGNDGSTSNRGTLLCACSVTASRNIPAHTARPARPVLVDILFVSGVTKFQHPRLHAVDGSLLEPFERRLEQQQMILFPHRVVRRAAEID